VSLVREIKFRPAFDKRDPNPSKNYGIHGAEMAWYLRGPDGAVQFVVHLNWHLPQVQREMDAKPLHSYDALRYMFHKPNPADLGYHSKVPRYDGQEPLTEKCEFTDNGPCYYDGSSLNAQEGFDILVAEGDEAAWQWMERYYRSVFSAVSTTKEQP
jgi:hypothetical protein